MMHMRDLDIDEAWGGLIIYQRVMSKVELESVTEISLS